MSSIQQLEAYLAELYAARSALLRNKSATIAGQTVTRAKEEWISSEITKTEARIARSQVSGMSAKVVFGRGGR